MIFKDLLGFTSIYRSGEILSKSKEILIFSKKIVITLKMVICSTLNFVFYDFVEVGEGPPGACYQYLGGMEGCHLDPRGYPCDFLSLATVTLGWLSGFDG